MGVSQPFDPAKSAGSFNDEIILAVVDKDVDVPGKKLFDEVGVLHHEVLVEVLVDVSGLGCVLDRRV